MGSLDLTIIIPSINEERSIGLCIEKAFRTMRRLGLKGEVLVADYKSTDRTTEIARSLGAKIVAVKEKGYGSAYLESVPLAQSDFIIMGDADDSYNFEEIGPYYDKLKAGHGFVMGNRFTGKIEEGAMPFLNRYLGTPVLTSLVNLFFKTNIGDSNCGMRGFTKSAFQALQLKTMGMEFASEMIIKAGLLGMKIVEVPCNLYRDKRGRSPHLRPWRDGWRNLRFMLLFAPEWTFMIPGVVLASLGAAGLAFLTLRDAFKPALLAVIDQKHMVSCSIVFLIGCQVLEMGFVAKTFNDSIAFQKPGRLVYLFKEYFQLECGIALGLSSVLLAALVFAYLLVTYNSSLFYRLTDTVRFDLAILGMAGVFLGVQIIFMSFLLSLFYLEAGRPGLAGRTSP